MYAPNPFTTHWLIRDAILAAHIPAAGSGSLLFAGDSIVEGFYWTRLEPYPVVNAGYSGAGAEALAPRLTRLVEWAKPQVVALLVGTNDAKEGRSPEQRQASARVYDTMIDGLARANLRPILLTPPPIENGKRLTAAFSRPAMAQIAAQAVAAGARHCWPVVDVHRAFLGSDLYAKPGTTIDGIHLAPASYRALRTMLEQAVARLPSEQMRKEG